MFVKIEKDFGGVLSIILNMWSIYTKYLGHTNKANKKYNKIHTCILRLKQELYISNNKRE